MLRRKHLILLPLNMEESDIILPKNVGEMRKHILENVIILTLLPDTETKKLRKNDILLVKVVVTERKSIRTENEKNEAVHQNWKSTIHELNIVSIENLDLVLLDSLFVNG